jgi:membrane protease subunit HflK
MQFFSWQNGEGPWGKPRPGGRRPGGGGRRSGGSDNQPDLEDVIRLAQERFGNWGGTGGGNQRRLLSLVIVAAVVLWLLSGFYIVAPDQAGVVTRFGQYVQTTGAGLHYHLPTPIESVQKPAVTRENVIEIGFRSNRGAANFFNASVSRGDNTNIQPIQAESLMLTGDENIVDLFFTVRWRIATPQDYLFNIADVPGTIKNLAESVMREVIGRRPIDDALTDNKTLVQQEAKQLLQNVLDNYQAGVQVTAVELQQVNPPEAVVDAFRDVQAARADAEKAVNQAKGYSNDILPRARGQVAQVMQDAEGYKAAKVAEAEGGAQRFLSQLREYKKAPEVTRKRLYLETMQQVMSEADKIVLPSGLGDQVLPYLPLNQLRQEKR